MKSLVCNIKEHVLFNVAETKILYSLQSITGRRFRTLIRNGSIESAAIASYLNPTPVHVVEVAKRLVKEVKPLIEIGII